MFDMINETFKDLLEKVKDIDLRYYIQGLGYDPKKKFGSDWWFDCWWDNDQRHRLGVSRSKWNYRRTNEHGDILDIAMRVYNTTNKIEAAKKILEDRGVRPSVPYVEVQENATTTQICEVRSLRLRPLVDYVTGRGISLHTANMFIQEVFYNFGKGGKNLFGIGFKNDIGGWEIRNRCGSMGKITIGQKYYTTKKFNKDGAWVVFEGFFDFLSFWEHYKANEKGLKEKNYLILNSTSEAEKAFQVLDGAKVIFLMLDNDEAGSKATATFVQRYGNIAQDKRYLFGGYNDYNDYLKAIGGK